MRNKIKTISGILTGNALAQLIVIFTTPLLTRIYTPNDFGSLAIANGVILTLGVIGSMRYDQLFFKYKDRYSWDKCYTNGIFATFMMSITLSIILLIFSFFINKNIMLYVVCLPLLVLFFSLSQIYSSVLSVSSKYTKITQSIIIRSVLIFCFQYYLFDFFNNDALIYGLVLGQFSQCLYLYITSRKLIIFNSTTLCYPCKDSVLSTFQSLSNSFSSQLPSLFIPYRFGLEMMGYYSMALRLTYMPITFLSNALRPFILGELSRNKEEKEKIAKILYIGSILLLLIGSVGIFFINYFSTAFFIFYAGDNWAISGDIASILSFWIMLAFSNILSTCYLTVFSKFKQLLVYDAFLLIIRISIVILTVIFKFDFFDFVKLYSSVGFLFNFSIIIYAILLVKK